MKDAGFFAASEGFTASLRGPAFAYVSFLSRLRWFD